MPSHIGPPAAWGCLFFLKGDKPACAPHAKETLPLTSETDRWRRPAWGLSQTEAVLFRSLGVTANTLLPGSLMSVYRKEDLWERSGPRTDPATTPYMRPWASPGTPAVRVHGGFMRGLPGAGQCCSAGQPLLTHLFQFYLMLFLQGHTKRI